MFYLSIIVYIVGVVIITTMLGCATGGDYEKYLPAFPRINHYAIQVKGKALPLNIFSSADDIRKIEPMSDVEFARCLKFEIISTNPYKLKYIGQVDLDTCNGLSGYTSDDILKVTNWMDDVNLWAQEVYKWAKEQLERRCLP